MTKKGCGSTRRGVWKTVKSVAAALLVIVLQWFWVRAAVLPPGAFASEQTTAASAARSNAPRQSQTAGQIFAFATRDKASGMTAVAVGDYSGSVRTLTVPLIDGIPSVHYPVGFVDRAGTKLLVRSETQTTPSKKRYGIVDVQSGQTTATADCNCGLFVT